MNEDPRLPSSQREYRRWLQREQIDAMGKGSGFRNTNAVVRRPRSCAAQSGIEIENRESNALLQEKVHQVPSHHTQTGIAADVSYQVETEISTTRGVTSPSALDTFRSGHRSPSTRPNGEPPAMIDCGPRVSHDDLAYN
jgi:hypothetical protein